MPVLGVTQIENAIAEKMASVDGATKDGALCGWFAHRERGN